MPVKPSFPLFVEIHDETILTFYLERLRDDKLTDWLYTEEGCRYMAFVPRTSSENLCGMYHPFSTVRIIKATVSSSASLIVFLYKAPCEVHTACLYPKIRTGCFRQMAIMVEIFPSASRKMQRLYSISLFLGMRQEILSILKKQLSEN